MLLDALVVSDDFLRLVHIVTFIAATAGAAAQPKYQSNACSDDNHTDVSSVDEHDPFDDSDHLEDQVSEPEQCSAERPVAEEGASTRVAQPVNQANHDADNAEPGSGENDDEKAF